MPADAAVTLPLVTFAAGLALGAILWRRQRSSIAAADVQPPVSVPDVQPPVARKKKAHDAAGTPPVLQCSMCHANLPLAAFSPRQTRKAEAGRAAKCQNCVESYEPTFVTVITAPASAATIPASTDTTASATAEAANAPAADAVGDPLRKARKAETVLRARTERVLLVLENCSDDLNHVAVLRTCEALGVHRVWLIEAEDEEDAAAGAPAVNADVDAGGEAPKGRSRLSARRQQKAKHGPRSKAWAQRGLAGYDRLLGTSRAQLYCSHLDVRRFPDERACLAALRADGRSVWVTDLAQEATPLASDAAQLAEALPPRLAIVLGSEGAGVSKTMLDAADRRVYLPMFGFTESYNLSVSAALVLQRLLDACPESRGDLPDDEMMSTRREWYAQLAKTESQRAEFEQLASSGGAEIFVDLRRPQQHRDEQHKYTLKRFAPGAGR